MAATVGLFEYSRVWTDASDFPSLSYQKDWNSSDDFPTIETDETQVRSDMQALYDEIADYINGTANAPYSDERWLGKGLRQYVVATGTAEETRIANEEQREKNENGYTDEEEVFHNGRVQNETARQAAETVRISNEDARMARESIRVENENQRIANDNERSVFVAWSESTAYVPGNKVSRQGSSYLCLAACTGVEPPNADYWLLIAEKGATGPQGAQGVQGPQGPRGINGAAVSTAGFVAFNVTEEGHLTVTYADDESMSFSINNDGHLLVTI